MDPRPKCKMQNYKIIKLLEDNIAENVVEFGNDILDNNSKGIIHEENSW
jgi:hypothetical protein